MSGFTLELLLITAHRAAVELAAELCFEPISTMGLVALRMMVRERPLRTTTSLAAALGCSRTSAGEIVDRLARDGLVERVVDPGDQRSRELRPTELGFRVAERARDGLAHCTDSFTASFSDEERETLLLLLGRLDLAADWHRTERMWGLHRVGGPGTPRRRPKLHVR